MSFYSQYIEPAWTWASNAWSDVSAGWKYGDEEFTEGVDYNSNFLYTVGDYAEDVYSLGSSIYKGYSAVTGGDDARDGPLATPKMVSSSAGSSYNPGSFTAGKVDFTKVGYSDPRVRDAYSKASRSQIPSIAATVQRVGLTAQSGRRTIGLPTSTISVRNTTRSA